MVEILKTTYPIARKQHICDYCGLPIQKGEKYCNDTCKLDDIYTWKSHLLCGKLTSEWNMADSDDGYGIRDDVFWEYVHDNVMDDVGEDKYEEMSDEDIMKHAYGMIGKEKDGVQNV